MDLVIEHFAYLWRQAGKKLTWQLILGLSMTDVVSMIAVFWLHKGAYVFIGPTGYRSAARGALYSLDFGIFLGLTSLVIMIYARLLKIEIQEYGLLKYSSIGFLLIAAPAYYLYSFHSMMPSVLLIAAFLVLSLVKNFFSLGPLRSVLER